MSWEASERVRRRAVTFRRPSVSNQQEPTGKDGAVSPVPSTETLEQEIAKLLEGITPGEWEVRKDLRKWEESVHYMVQTVEKLPAHPHSQRFIAWMCGSLGETTSGHWNERQKQGMGWRDDPAIEADAKLMAASPRLLRAALSALTAERQRAEELESELFAITRNWSKANERAHAEKARADAAEAKLRHQV
jgi:hypothetical protein